MKISEKDKQAAFALLILAAAAVVAYALIFATPPDKPSSLDGFVANAANYDNISLFMDARGADTATARKIYQCGTDLAAGQLFGSHLVETYGCDDSGCISASSSQNGSARLTYESARLMLRGQPYVEIKQGSPQTLFFENHMEIYLDSSFNGTCKIG